LALGFGTRAVVTPHIGDLDSPRGRDVFARVARDLQDLHGVRASRLVLDAHPGYGSRPWARASGLAAIEVAHHHAHASAAVSERPDVSNWLVFAWDGVGLGEDRTRWGGEALVGMPGAWRRAGSMRVFRPPGGERAAREPWRSAAAACWDAGLDFAPDIPDLSLARAAWSAGRNAPATSAVGRLFDAAASIVLGLDRVSHEAQAPMRLEALARDGAGASAVDLPLCDDDGVLRIDWRPLLAMLRDQTICAAQRAAGLHESLAQAAFAQAQQLRERHRIDAVALCGGVFQNRVLSESLRGRFARAGIDGLLPSRLPVNDAGLAFGQLAEVAAREQST
ncbi:MAG: carbamoyltransferase HypF, partial [Burkholderiaceae bacterium]